MPADPATLLGVLAAYPLGVGVLHGLTPSLTGGAALLKVRGYAVDWWGQGVDRASRRTLDIGRVRGDEPLDHAA